MDFSSHRCLLHITYQLGDIQSVAPPSMLVISFNMNLECSMVSSTEWPDPFAAEVSEAFKLDEDGNLIMSVKIKRKSGESCDIQ